MLAWIDLEMTGLDPDKDVIVEIASIVTDDDLKIVATGPELVMSTDQALIDGMEPIVVDMHTKSGLIDRIKESNITIAEAEKQTLEFFKEHIKQEKTVPLCGNSIGMDRRFLAKQMPTIENFLHYRSVDVSTLKELARRWYPDALAKAPRKEADHRALADITESIKELQFYRGTLFKEQRK